MRRHRWKILVFLLILLALACVARRYVVPRQVGEDNIQGMSRNQLRASYGEPNWIVDQNHWVYYRGMFGGGTGIEFKGDVVVHYETRGAQ